MDRQDPARAEDFVGGANMERQMSPQEMRMMQMQGLLGRPSQLLDEGIRQFASGAITQSEAEARGADRLAQLADRTARDLEASQKENELRRQKSLERLEQQSQKYEDLTNKLADFQFDPSGGFSSKSSLNKALTAIAIGVGGAADAFLGQPNQTLGIVENAIKRDIDAQKMRFSALQGRAEAQKSLFGQMMDIFGSEEAAAAATEAALLKSMAFRTEAIKNKTQSEAVAGQLNQQIGQYLLKAGELEGNLAALGLRAIQADQERIRPLPESVVSEVRDLESVSKGLDDLLSKVIGPEGVITGRLPGFEAREFNRLAPLVTRRAVDVLAKRGRGEKELRQLRELMTVSASTLTADKVKRLQNLQRLISQELETTADVFGRTGFDVTGLEQLAPIEGFEERR